MKKQSGITLIALVVTIIVLIILAGISINLLFGDNGIIKKAIDAGKVSDEASIKEDLAMAWLGVTSDYYEGLINNPTKKLNESMTKGNLDPYLTKGALEGTPVYKDGEYKVKYQTDDDKVYTIVIDKNGNMTVTGVTKPLQGTTAEMVKENPELYYGKRVKYSAKGIDDWKIFYADDDNIFLITSDFITKDKLNVWQTALVTSGSENGIYGSFWATNPPGAQQVTDSVRSSFMWDGFTDYSTYKNGRCISTVLRTENWSWFVNSKYADYAIGSPTLEMFVASWNNLYPDNKLYCNNTNYSGYYVGTSSNPTSFDICHTDMQAMEGYNNTLYYPHPIPDIDNQIYEGVAYYRLAATSAYGEWKIIGVHNAGAIGIMSFDGLRGTFRPIVRLKSSTTIETGTEGYDYNLIDNSI